MAATEDFTFQKGEDVTINWTITVSDGGAAANITGWTFSLKVKQRNSAADPSLVTATHNITTAASGLMTTTIASADTDDLEGEYQYSLWRTNSGAKSCLKKGTMTFQDTTEF